jgi:hypothetical protein
MPRVIVSLRGPCGQGGRRRPAYEAAERTDSSSRMAHQQLLEKARMGGIDLYFLGDSIIRRRVATEACGLAGTQPCVGDRRHETRQGPSRENASMCMRSRTSAPCAVLSRLWRPSPRGRRFMVSKVDEVWTCVQQHARCGGWDEHLLGSIP